MASTIRRRSGCEETEGTAWINSRTRVCTLTVSDLSGGALRVTGVRRFDAQGQPVP